jgi:hypothetical protein
MIAPRRLQSGLILLLALWCLQLNSKTQTASSVLFHYASGRHGAMPKRDVQLQQEQEGNLLTERRRSKVAPELSPSQAIHGSRRTIPPHVHGSSTILA